MWAALAALLQWLIQPITAPDSYQVLLGFVAVSVIYGGMRSGFVTLAITAAAKFWLIVLPEISLAAQGQSLLARMILYLAIGFVICYIGGQLHASERRLEDALAKVRTLSGLLPICASCKRIRDDRGDWHQMENYIRSHSNADFSHGICPECIRRLYPEMADRVQK